MRIGASVAVTLAILSVSSLAFSADHQLGKSWTGADLNSKGGTLPFSFVFGGEKSDKLLRHWTAKTQLRQLDDNRKSMVLTRTDPKTGLEVRCVAVIYRDSSSVEWTVYLKNTGNADTPIIEDLQGLNTRLERTGSSEFLLHHNVGSPANRSDYAPLETPLEINATKVISAAGGRSTNSDMSYFNLAWGNQGAIIVVGWPGQWKTEFIRQSDRGIQIQAGQEQTHFKLHPGEEIRTPLIVLMNYQGDWIAGQNKWRHWMMKYGMPKPNGQLPKPMLLAMSGRAYGEMIGANEANQIMHIDRYLEEGLGLNYWWMDAGWYVQTKGWPQVGTWEMDKTRFPMGFRPISDHAHAKGVKTLTWFEPERVAPDTWLSKNRPEWLLGSVSKLELKRSTALGGNEPCVNFNTDTKVLNWNGITWGPRSLSFHPGPKGEYSVVRWTAPTKGEYKISSSFYAIDPNATTDVHVIGGKQNLFSDVINLNGKGKRTGFIGTVQIEAGESINFIVGYGNGAYPFDSTGLTVSITEPNGVRHQAAEEYKSGNWSYGYLQPGQSPDPVTLKEYDKTEKLGENGNKLFDFGNPDARKWMTERVDKLIVDNGIDLYRQDFNMDPLSFWRENDAPDRQGITENKHVVGYLAYWDELIRRHPGMLIDSCASGGRRNDLETMRRAVPLWRSDYAYEPIGHQGMMYGISMWLPFHGTGTVAAADAPYYGGGFTPVQPYAFWSNASPSIVSGIDIRVKEIDYASLRKLLGNWREVNQYYYGDYYPLTPYSQADDVWIAWQFNRSKNGDGIVQAFRRPKAPNNTIRVKLRGLDPKASYATRAIDAKGNEFLRMSGAELMTSGLPIAVKEQPGAAVIQYSRVKS